MGPDLGLVFGLYLEVSPSLSLFISVWVLACGYPCFSGSRCCGILCVLRMNESIHFCLVGRAVAPLHPVGSVVGTGGHDGRCVGTLSLHVGSQGPLVGHCEIPKVERGADRD